MKEKGIPDFWVGQQIRCQWCFLRKGILNENKKDKEDNQYSMGDDAYCYFFLVM